MASFSQGMYLIEDSPAIACYKIYWAEEERNQSILLALPCNSNFHQLLQAFFVDKKWVGSLVSWLFPRCYVPSLLFFNIYQPFPTEQVASYLAETLIVSGGENF